MCCLLMWFYCFVFHHLQVSPVDGTILQCGKVECGNVEQVKGVSYSLPTFLGPQTWNQNNNNYITCEPVDKQKFCSSLLKNKNNALFHCVIYLAPGDYHRFHSPVQWNVNFRRHFAGIPELMFCDNKSTIM